MSSRTMRRTPRRLYWVGTPELGGILVVAPTRREALRRGHDEMCTCNEQAECLRDADWDALLVERLLPSDMRARIHVGGDPTEWRLWWGFTDDDGHFVIARTCEDAKKLIPHGYEVRPVDEVDGYSLRIEVGSR